MPIDYFKIIHKYIKPNTKLYRIYIIHVTLVTNKALKIARCLSMPAESRNFIEEASMLHDIGIIKVHAPDLYAFGKLPYITHGIEGAKILLREGLKKHARVAEAHTGVGIFEQDIKRFNLPIPLKNYVPKTMEEKIISYADLFFSKDIDKLWIEKQPRQIEKRLLDKFGKKHANIFKKWHKMFNCHNE